MRGLVALATVILRVLGRVVAALLLAGFLILYAALGLIFTPIVAVAFGLYRLPRQLRVFARLFGRAQRSAARGAPPPRLTPGR